MISSFRTSAITVAASVLMTSCAHSQDTFALTECSQKARTLHEMLADVDVIALVSVDEIADVKGYEWQMVSFNVVDAVKGDFPSSFEHPAKVLSPENSVFYARMLKVYQRAQAHDSPEFLAGDVRQFPAYGDIQAVNVVSGEREGSAMNPIDDTCVRVPYLMRGLEYLLLLRGGEIVSVEPILQESDYWFRFVIALEANNYWPIYSQQ